MATKTEGGASFPAAAYAYVPDASTPSTWKLRLWRTPGGGPDAGIVGAAIAALGKGFRGNRVQIPADARAGVKRKVRAAWRKANPDKGDDEMPAVLREAEEDYDMDDDLLEGQPAEARDVNKGLERLLGLARIPASIKGPAQALRTALNRRMSPWDAEPDDEDDDGHEGETEEAEIAGEFATWPLTEGPGDGTREIRIIAPGWGSSGYYTKEALQGAARDRVFKRGLHMYWNHPSASEERERPERDLRDLAATLVEDARWSDAGALGPGLYARVQPVKHYSDHIANLAPHIGTSIRATGSGRMGEAEGRKGRIIEAIPTARSVDFVTAPGAGGKIIDLFEAARPGNTNPPEDDPMELKEAIDKLALAEAARDEATAKLAEAQKRADEAEGKLILTEGVAHIRQRLEAHQMPEPTRQRIVRDASVAVAVKDGKLDTAALDTAVDEAMKAETAYLEEVLGRGKVRGLGDSKAPDGPSEEDLKESATKLDSAFGRLRPLAGDAAKDARAIAVNGRR